MIAPNEIESDEYFCSDCGGGISPSETKCPYCGSVFDSNDIFLSHDIEQGRTLSKIIIRSVIAISIITGIIELINFDTRSLSIFFIR